MAPPVTVSVAEFSRRAEIPNSTARLWIKQGRIPKHDNGKIPVRAGLAAVRRIQGQREEGEEESEERGSLEEQLLQARVRATKAQGELRELQLAHEQGLFVLAEEVQVEGRALGATLRTGLLAIPQRAALKLEAILAATLRPIAPGAEVPRAPAIEALLLDEINAVLVALQGPRYTP